MAQLDDPADRALLALLSALAARGYQFVAPTPATHERVLRRDGGRPAETLRDVFGWSRPFGEAVVGPEILDLMRRAEVLRPEGGGFRSTVRVSSLDGCLFLHSAFPAKQSDAVFFGPDTYRFADFLRAELGGGPVGRVADVGTGAGAGGIVMARARPEARVVLSDVNPKALQMARVNAAHAGVEAEIVEGSGLEAVEGEVDLVIANPPYMATEDDRTYREGGALHGAALSLEWARAAAERLGPGGRLLLYTGSAIVGGEDRLREELGALFGGGWDWSYRELDPDVFGEELDKPAYAEVERIAVVGVSAMRRGGTVARRPRGS